MSKTRPPVETHPEPSNHAEDIQKTIKYVTDQSVKSSRRMKTLCQEANEAGIKILGELDNQGEQLDSIEKGMRDIHQDMVQAKETLQGMNTTFPGLCLPCTKIKSSKSDAFKPNENGTKGGVERRPQISHEGVPSYGGFISRYTSNAEEDEMEKNLEQVSYMIGKLRNMAIDIGNETSNQNAQIYSINYMADENLDAIDKANVQTHNILK